MRRRGPRRRGPEVSASAERRALAADTDTRAAAPAIAGLLNKSPSVIPSPGMKDLALLRDIVDGTRPDLAESDMNELECRLPPDGRMAAGMRRFEGWALKSSGDRHPSGGATALIATGASSRTSLRIMARS